MNKRILLFFFVSYLIAIIVFLPNKLLAQKPDWYSTCWPHEKAINYDEPYRGQFHNSPLSGWMNDIDMLVYYIGIYHMAYQAEHENVLNENIFPPYPKIMPLGASRVEGGRPDYESFRYELWKNLTENSWSFDYIGTMTDPASYANYSGQVFDKDHEGYGGYTSVQILSNINEWISSAGIPDIVLFSSPGGNDALEGLPVEEALSNINGIIDIIQTANPCVTIFIEQPAPGHSDIMTTELTAYIKQLQYEVLTIATQQTTTTSSVIAVDMFTGWSDAYLADDVHYNTAGAKIVADRYDAAMEAFYLGQTSAVIKKMVLHIQ